jgi:SsrA-binding protein
MAGKNKNKKSKSDENRYRQVAQNRRARRDYFIEEKFEAGLVLTGTEVKSLRAGHANIREAYATEKPRRARKLLLHKRQIEKLIGGVQKDGMTVVPLALYFNKRGIAKLEVGLAKGKKQFDKREDEKKRDWQREKARLLRDKG